MFNPCAKFEVSIYTYYNDMKGDANGWTRAWTIASIWWSELLCNFLGDRVIWFELNLLWYWCRCSRLWRADSAVVSRSLWRSFERSTCWTIVTASPVWSVHTSKHFALSRSLSRQGLRVETKKSIFKAIITEKKSWKNALMSHENMSKNDSTRDIIC